MVVSIKMVVLSRLILQNQQIFFALMDAVAEEYKISVSDFDMKNLHNGICEWSFLLCTKIENVSDDLS